MSATLKLCGFAASNYYNKVKLALLEKGIAFQEQKIYPAKNEVLLERSAMGKIPYLEVDGVAIAESQVIIEYLEDAYPTPSLYPSGAVARALCRELIQIVELHLELQARRLYGAAFFGGQASDETKTEVARALRRGAAALARRAKFAPFLTGENFTYADCAAAVHLPVVRDAAKTLFGADPFFQLSALKAYLNLIRTRPSMERIRADRDANMKEFTELRTALEHHVAPAAT